MLDKIKSWWLGRKIRHSAGTAYALNQPDNRPLEPEPVLYTTEEVNKITEDVRRIAYNDGRSDGLAIARNQATQSLKEILWQQNQTSPTNKPK